jgi:uncharacterized protein YbaP (TraB family)
MRRLVLLCLSGWLIATCSPAVAQVQATPPAPTAATSADASAVVDELAPVQINMPGPAVWKVTRGDSQVIILGFIRPLPHMLQWDTGRITHALDGAHALLIPAAPRLGVFDAMGLMLAANTLHNPGGRTLDKVLTPADYQTFLQATATAHTDPKHYARWKPVIAGAALIGDLRKAAGLSDAKPVSTVSTMAKAMHVPVREMGHLKLAPLVKIITGMDDAHGLACYRAEMRQFAWEASEARTAANAWAHGDVAGMRRTRAAVTTCLEDLPRVQALTERGTADAVAAMDEALSRPSKSVALVEMQYLDRSNGLLDRLRAKGAVISVPTN